jgi:hypothetical protein
LLIESDIVSLPSDAHPLHLATGHVYMKDEKTDETKILGAKKDVRDDRTRHYFCGKDWHDATKCHSHCPNGLSSECPDGETCYADTPCDALASKIDKQDEEQRTFDAMFTPQGSLPAVATLWDNGEVTMHAMAVSNSTRKIEFIMLWKTNLLANYTILNWENEHIELLDAKTAVNGHGLVLLTASVDLDYRAGEELIRISFVAALNAKTGIAQWESLSDDETLNPKPKRPLPLQDDSRSSIARKRRVLHSKNNHHGRTQNKDNCMHLYRRSVLTSGVLPYLYWDRTFATSKALHFDAQQTLEKQHYHAKEKRNVAESSWFAGQRSKSSHHRYNLLHKGKPNVVATANEHGLQLRSLRNGRLLCHLSLWEETLYTDLNHDGTVDSVNVVTGKRSLRDDDEHGEARQWISELVSKVAKIQGGATALKTAEEELGKQTIVEAHLCHLHALSGLPAKEELFSTNVCGPTHLSDVEDAGYATPAPPLAVEAIHGKGNDIIAAISTGHVTRVHGASGRIIWQANSGRSQTFPTWEDNADVTMTRIESNILVPENRPLLLLGENSLAILSARHGKQLALSPYPQLSQAHTMKPLVEDFNGDGTSDVIIPTDDALWGYAVHIQVGSSLPFRVAVGLLLMLLMLALLRNRFGPQPGHRSTDA